MSKTLGAITIGVCFLIAALEGYDIQAFGVAAPKLATLFALNPGQVGRLATAAMVGLVIGAFAGGWAADRWGRKPVLLVSVIAFGAFSLATAFAPSEPLLLASRLATGIGFGGAMPNLVAIAAEIARPGRRGAVTSAIFCGFPAGGAAVSLAARLGGQDFDWRWLFIAGGALPLVIAPLVAWLLPETRPEPEASVPGGLPRALFGHGRAGGTLLLWTANVLTLVVIYLMVNWLPSLVVAKGHAAGDGAAASMAFNVLGVAGALSVGLLMDRIGVRWSLTLAYAALAAAIWALSRSADLAPIFAFSGAVGFLSLGAQYVVYGLAPLLYPPGVRAAGAGAAVGIGRFGSILGPLIAGELRQAGWSAGQVLSAVAPAALIAGGAIFLLTLAVNSPEFRPAKLRQDNLSPVT
jgi:AAHS family 3-hydroxyphenylpropionic acid transporter